MRGSYVLLFKLIEDSKIKIGKLGTFFFPKGYYCYIGSALGRAVNLESRVRRHKKLLLTKKGRLRWHIDYFSVHPKVLLIEAVFVPSNKKLECKISRSLAQIAKPIKNFGSSDCKCESHFYYLGKTLNLKKFYERIIDF